MSGGLVLGGSYQRQFKTLQNLWLSLRDAEPQNVESTGGPVHAIKANWVFELPFGQGRRFASGASGWKNGLISGWEINGCFARRAATASTTATSAWSESPRRNSRTSSSSIARRMPPGSSGCTCSRASSSSSRSSRSDRTDPTHPTGYVNGIVPTGRYLAPASGPDCVQYLDGMCPGTALRRIVEGPWYFKTDLSFAKRINTGGRTWVEARMDVFNVFDNVNFVATTRNRQRAVGVGSHRGGDRPERGAGSGRPDHAVQSALQLVRE